MTNVSRRGRVAALLSISLLGVTAGVARADAPDPVISATTGSAVYNSDGSRTVTIQGQWRWTTHHTDCNSDARAVGFAIDWGDSNGNPVGATGFSVGVLNATSLNAADNNVHPTPATTIPSPAFGGCGVFAAHIAPDPVGSYNTGTWGPISHTYDANTGAVAACPLMYDVHLQSDGGAPQSSSWVTAGGASRNHDNSAESNGATPLGNGCFTTTFPALTTHASAGGPQGVAVHDTATLSGGNAATGSITFRLFNNATCSGTPAATVVNSSVAGDGDYDSPSATPAAGAYHWVATYSGDANNQPVTTACSDSAEAVTISPPPGNPPGPSLTPVGQQQVLGERTVAGDAHIAGATGCVGRAFKVRISGHQIQRVVFKIDGKRKASLSKPNSGSSFVLKVNPNRFRPGSHLVVATSSFRSSSNTKPRTLKLRFSRCVRRSAPAFTG